MIWVNTFKKQRSFLFMIQILCDSLVHNLREPTSQGAKLEKSVLLRKIIGASRVQIKTYIFTGLHTSTQKAYTHTGTYSPQIFMLSAHAYMHLL